MKTLLFIVFLSVSANTALAAENRKTICTNGDQERIIEIIYSTGNPVPCEVHYTKNTGSEVLWRAQEEVGYCEKKADAFIKKQESWGWQCETVTSLFLEPME